jgi:hypothetical protein
LSIDFIDYFGVRVSEGSLPRIDVHQHLWSEPLVAEAG